MKNSSAIQIKEQMIAGIKNPVLLLKIFIDLKNYEFEIYADGNKITDYQCSPTTDNKTVLLRVNIPFSSKKVSVFLLNDNKKQEIYNMKNSLIRRIGGKIGHIFKTIIKRTITFFKVSVKGIIFLWKKHHFLVPPKMMKTYLHRFKERIKGRNTVVYDPFNKKEYNEWLKNHPQCTEVIDLKYKPLISLLIPVYNIDKKCLSECLDSILNQSYDNFEVCLVDDCSTNQETIDTLDFYEKKDERIKVKHRTKNGHISAATNDALSMAKGEFIGLIDDDDLLAPNALYENVKVLNSNKKLDFIYSDEDKLDLKGKYCDPHFKPDWSPDTLLSLNYICHFVIIRKKLVTSVDGFTIGLEGAQDHDLFLKVTEKTNNIHHIPLILYHWRMVEGSTSMTITNKSYATDKGKMAIENALKRRGIKGHVEKDEVSTYYRVVYELDKEPLVSIIIPTRDYMDITKKCVDSIYEKTTYKNFEIIIANNDSQEKETLDFFKEYSKKYKNFKVIDCIMEFNYSRINNKAIKNSKGEYIVLLNNDTEIITPEWLTYMVGYASQKHVGCVGAKLLYPDMTVQHAGVILGLGVASHAYLGETRDSLGMYGRLRVPYDYAANTAACLVVSRKKFEEVNGLEEDLKVAYNDVDFNIKLLKAGYYNVTLQQVEIMHYESKSRGLDTTSEKYKRFMQESQYMWDKWSDILNNDPFYNPNFTRKDWFTLDIEGSEKIEK